MTHSQIVDALQPAGSHAARYRLALAELIAALQKNQEDLVAQTSTTLLRGTYDGSKFLDQLSHDLRNEFREMQGFSRRNLENMRSFASLYPNIEFAKQAVSQYTLLG